MLPQQAFFHTFEAAHQLDNCMYTLGDTHQAASLAPIQLAWQAVGVAGSCRHEEVAQMSKLFKLL